MSNIIEQVDNTNPEVRTQVASIAEVNPGATLGANLGNGTTSVALSGLTIGQTYHVQGVGGSMSGCTLDGVALSVSGGATSFVATATDHTVAKTSGTATSITVQVIVSGSIDKTVIGGGVVRIKDVGNLACGTTNHQYLTTGARNAAFSPSAQSNVTTGSNNVALGATAQQKLTTGSDNIAVGVGAQLDATGASRNVAVGRAAQGAAGFAGSDNVAVGTYAQFELTEGSSNTSVGVNSQYALTTGSDNVAFGVGAGRGFVAGNYNTSVGNRAGYVDQSDVSGSVQIGADSTGTGAFTTADNTIALGTTLHTMKCGAVDGDTGYWAFGVRKAGTVALDTTQYLTVKVDGVTYKVGIVE